MFFHVPHESFTRHAPYFQCNIAFQLSARLKGLSDSAPNRNQEAVAFLAF